MKHGHILNENHKAFIADYIDGGAQLGAGQNDYSLEVRAFESFDIDEINEHLSNSLISGAVILGTELDEEDVAQFLKIHIPIVFIDILFPHMPYDFVDMNNDSSVYNIVSHLSQMGGHEDVGIVTGLYETSNFTHRRISFEKSLKLFGLNGRGGEHYFTVDSTYEGGAYKGMLDVLADRPKLPPTALFFV